MSQSINFKDLSNHLRPHLLSILTEFVSGGELSGREYKASSIYGGKGSSFAFNIDTQKWADFAANDHQGGDIISLVAKIKSISQFDAAKLLADQYGYVTDNSARNFIPNFIMPNLGKPERVYIYKNILGQPTHAVPRYVLEEKNSKGKFKKEFRQWHFNDEQNKWIAKTTETTPLYNLDLIKAFPDKKVVVCEGEKAAEAAQKVLGDKSYVTTCWIGGSKLTVIKKVNLSALFGRNVVLWPDNDEEGINAMAFVAEQIAQAATSINLIMAKESDPATFDAADLLDMGLSNADRNAWLKDRLVKLKPSSDVVPSASGLFPRTHPEEPTLGTPSTSLETVPHRTAEIMSANSTDDQPANKQLAIPITNADDRLSPFDQAKASDRWQKMGLQMKSQYKVFETEENVNRIFLNDPVFKDAFFYDTFYKENFTKFDSPTPIPFDDSTVTRIKMYLQRQYMFGAVSTAAVKAVIDTALAMAPDRNQLKERLDTLVWDQKPRINKFMEDIYGVESSDYTTSVSRIFWLSMVKRIIQPGCKADIMIILEGPEGIKKSHSLEVIGGKHYDIAGKDPKNKDFYQKLTGNFLVEMGELNSFTKSEHNDIQEMLSTTTDKFRVPYGRSVQAHPRTCIFVGTTNDSNYLKSENARRYLPVTTTKVEFDLLKADLDQYFAEAMHRLNAGEDHWEFPRDLAKEQTQLRQQEDDPWVSSIAEWVSDVSLVRTSTLLDIVLGVRKEMQNATHSKRIGQIMRKLGFLYDNRTIKGKRYKLWIHKGFEIRAYESDQDKLDNIAFKHPIGQPTRLF